MERELEEKTKADKIAKVMEANHLLIYEIRKQHWVAEHEVLERKAKENEDRRLTKFKAKRVTDEVEPRHIVDSGTTTKTLGADYDVEYIIAFEEENNTINLYRNDNVHSASFDKLHLPDEVCLTCQSVQNDTKSEKEVYISHAD